MSLSDYYEVPAKRFKLDDSVIPPGNEGQVVFTADVNDDGKLLEKLQKLLLCPSCCEIIRPTVDICSNGHSVCGQCRTRLSFCPRCAGQFVRVNNTMLEELSKCVKYPCLNAKGGCKETMYLTDEEEHLKQCRFRFHPCKIGDCTWTGSKDELQNHVEAHHPEHLWVQNRYFSCVKTFDGCSDKYQKFVVADGEFFWLLGRYDPDGKTLYEHFQYIGQKDVARSFVYQLCLVSIDESRKFLFKSMVDDDVDDFIGSPNCAVIDLSVLRSFSMSDTELRLKFNYCLNKLSH